MFNNYEAGGASFVVSVPYGPAATFKMAGEIDWKKHQIRGVLETPFSSGAPSQSRPFAVADGVVMDRGVMGLNEVMAERGAPGVSWVARVQ